MKPALLAVALAGLCLSRSASAHRLDELLQATTLAVASDRVTIQLRLTPGVAVASTVLAELDADGDGVLSAQEQRAYALRVSRDLLLTLDGKLLELRLASSAFPDVEEMRGGVGEILLTFTAQIPPGPSIRRLVFENHHQPKLSAYLVNCLAPEAAAFRILAQNRNYEQSFYQLDYAQATPGS